MSRVAIIGGGGMGEALLAGLLDSGHPARDLVVAEKNPVKAKKLTETYPVLVTTLKEAIENADFVIAAVKPGDIGIVLSAFAERIIDDTDGGDSVFVSIAAGVTLEEMESHLPAGTPVVRVMPNTPAKVAAGASALVAGKHVTSHQLREIIALFQSVGYATIVNEDQIDAVTGVSGSGPAYFFLAAEALIDAGVAAGLSRATSTALSVQTMLGAAVMLVEHVFPDGLHADTDTDPYDTTPLRLRAEVTSPGGTTAAGIAALESHGLRSAFYAAVQAAQERSKRSGKLKITVE